MEPRKASTLIDYLRLRAAETPDASVFTFLPDGDSPPERWSFDRLDREARRIGGALQRRLSPGDRALLLYPNGLEYVSAFYGCLYAGVIAVPAQSPRVHHAVPRLAAMAVAAQASCVLTTADIAAQQNSLCPPGSSRLATLPWLGTDAPLEGAEDWLAPEAGPHTIALLQYTSGSTATPKGVTVSHGNLLANLDIFQERFAYTAEDVIVSWLPLYHDMKCKGPLLPVLWKGGLGGFQAA